MTATMVTERPIPFSGPMVRALLDGSKTQTRRLVNPQPHERHWLAPAWGCSPDGVAFGEPYLWRECGADYPDGPEDERRCPYGVPGDRLWVKEAIRGVGLEAECARMVEYVADGTIHGDAEWVWQREMLPSIFMPRGLSRLTLTITDVRVERLRAISVEDARAEGISEYGHEFRDEKWFPGDDMYRNSSSPENYARLWDAINSKRAPWSSNPWVWVVAFEVASS